MKNTLYSLIVVLAGFMLMTSCEKEVGSLPGNDTDPFVAMTLSSASLPNDPDCDVVVRLAANSAATDVYYFAETEAQKNSRNLAEDAYADYVVQNGKKATLTKSEYDGANIADLVIKSLYKKNIVSAVAVAGDKKYIVSKDFTGIQWNTLSTGTYKFAKAAIANAVGSATVTTSLQQSAEDETQFRFKDVYGVGHNLNFFVLPDYTATDSYGTYTYARIAAQATGLSYGSYGAVSVRDIGYWQGDDSYITDSGFEGCYYSKNLVILYAQYYVSAGSLGYGYEYYQAN